MIFYCLRIMLTLFLSVALSLAVPLTSPVFARGEGNDGGSGVMGGGGGGAGLSNATTKQVVKIIKRGVSRCQTVPLVYRFDCYRQTYKQAATYLNGRPAYADAQKALIAVEEALDRIMAQNVDPGEPPIRKGVQRFYPVKPAAVPKVKAELTSALDQAETMLLRAPDRSAVHYARIADAVRSNKVLLRSRLYPDGTEMFRSAFA